MLPSGVLCTDTLRPPALRITDMRRALYVARFGLNGDRNDPLADSRMPFSEPASTPHHCQCYSTLRLMCNLAWRVYAYHFDGVSEPEAALDPNKTWNTTAGCADAAPTKASESSEAQPNENALAPPELGGAMMNRT